MKKIILIIFAVLIISGIAAFAINFSLNQNSFEVNPTLFKTSLNRGETLSTTLNVKNLGESENFTFSIKDLNNTFSLSSNKISIKKGETGSVNVNVSAINAKYGIYVGHILISNGVDSQKIPVITSVHTSNQVFAINLNVAPEDKQLQKGGSLSTDINFFNIYDNDPHPVTLKYEVFNLDGEIILSESEDMTIGSKLSFTKKLQLPQDIEDGNYVFAVILNYSNTTTSSNYLFSVGAPDYFSFFNVNFLAVIVVIFVILTFVLILYTLHERKKLFSQLDKQHKMQVKDSSEKIIEEREKYINKAKTEQEKKKILEDFDDAKDKIVGELRKQYKEHVEELRKLKEKKIGYQEEKLKQWRKEGYQKALESADIKSELKNKLAALKTAYDEGFIKKGSYTKGISEIKSANKKLKRNLYK